MDLGLKGKIAVVTGASQGIGRSIALQLAAEGADIAVCARGQQGIDDVLKELQAFGVRAFGQVADVLQRDEVESFINAAASALGGIDILINNVGGSSGRGLMESTDDEWFGTFDVNVFQSVRASRAAVPHMKARGGGSIVIISSISGYKPLPSSQYGAAKAAEIFLSGSIALELAPSNIRVNTVCPGSILFPGGGWAGFQERDAAGFGRFETEEFPLGRLGTPEEVARVVAFVASPAGSWINGGMVPVDGGQQAPAVYQKGPVWR
ncbi:MAG: 3-oxoacyl-(acyl-carrier-protein) reductase [Chloroflexi bacterium]|nr:3-oxoacyl-(acyl-carrier-protein) reductase [Chloroflexota bacterium]